MDGQSGADPDDDGTTRARGDGWAVQVDGGSISIPLVEQEVRELEARRAAAVAERDRLSAEIDAIAARVAKLHQILRWFNQESGTCETPQEYPASPVTLDLVLSAMRELPAGGSLSTRELHDRMVDGFGYGLSSETVRKVAQRMVRRGLLVKVGRGEWSLPQPSTARDVDG